MKKIITKILISIIFLILGGWLINEMSTLAFIDDIKPPRPRLQIGFPFSKLWFLMIYAWFINLLAFGMHQLINRTFDVLNVFESKKSFEWYYNQIMFKPFLIIGITIFIITMGLGVANSPLLLSDLNGLITKSESPMSYSETLLFSTGKLSFIIYITQGIILKLFIKPMFEAVNKYFDEEISN